MSAAPAHKVLTADDLLALVRRSPQQFKKKSLVNQPDGDAAPGFVPQVPVRQVDESDFAPVPQPDLEETPDPTPAQTEQTGQDDVGGPPPTPEAEAPAEAFNPADPPEIIDIEAERQAAWAAGHDQAMQEIETARLQARDEALAEARDEADQTLEEVRTAFESALLRLNSAEQEVATTLTAHLETAIRILASDRAGQKIDDTPQPFLRRIEKMAREIAAGAESLVVEMNPADLMAIKPHIKSFSPLSKARLSPSPKLGRGDLNLKMDAITFSDVISDRQSGGLR